jgi:hypothetical protein
MKSSSKIGCRFLCDLQRHIGHNIQHVHYNKLTKSVIGNEFVLPEYKAKRVDGYYVDSEGRRVVVEFLGNIFHGYPSLWEEDEDACNYFGTRYKDSFEKTEQMFTTVTSFGYIVRYAWESDYKKLKALQSPLSILREFNGKLEF